MFIIAVFNEPCVVRNIWFRQFRFLNYLELMFSRLSRFSAMHHDENAKLAAIDVWKTGSVINYYSNPDCSLLADWAFFESSTQVRLGCARGCEKAEEKTQKCDNRYLSCDQSQSWHGPVRWPRNLHRPFSTSNMHADVKISSLSVRASTIKVNTNKAAANMKAWCSAA